MSKRALSVGMLTAGLSAGLIAGVISPAAAQGNPVGGSGSVYFLGGAGSTGGQAQEVLYFGNPDDEVFYGDWDNDGVDTPMVRRGGTFCVANREGRTVDVFAYGNPGDRVLIGDWDGKNGDSIAVLRDGNHFFVKNDVKTTGKADSELDYGDPGDNFLVGDWNGDGKDTLTVSRADTSFYVLNTLEGGKAEYSFFYGNPGDTVLVGDWADPANGQSGNGADQLAVRRDGNHYFLSKELGKDANVGQALRDFRYGEATDTVFTAALPTPQLNADGTPKIDEKRTATYEAEVVGKFEGGETFRDFDGAEVTDANTGRAKQHKAGETQYFFAGEEAFHLGGEPVIGTDGKQETWDEGDQITIHDAADIYISEKGSVLRDKSTGALLTWGNVDDDDVNFPDVDLDDDESNTREAKKDEPKIYRPGQAMEGRQLGELAFYGAEGSGSEWEANDDVYTQEEGDYLLTPAGELRYDDRTNLPMQYEGANKPTTPAKAKEGAPVLARAGQVMLADEAFDNDGDTDTADAREILNDELPGGTYLGQSIAKLDEDKDAEPAVYKGGEQLRYRGGETIPAFVGGEPIVTHHKGDAILNADGTPKVTGTGQALPPIKGDGLGVRRNY